MDEQIETAEEKRRGRGRPQIDDARESRVQARLTEDESAALDIIAARSGMSRSEWMRWAARRQMEAMLPLLDGDAAEAVRKALRMEEERP